MFGSNNLEEVYDLNITEGNIKFLEHINKAKINLLIADAGNGINSAKNLIHSSSKNSKDWVNVFTFYYDSLHNYSEALLCFKQIECLNSQALFAVLCLKFPNLELDWNFLERMRNKRETLINLDKLNYNDWKLLELQLGLYISILKEELEKNYSFTL